MAATDANVRHDMNVEDEYYGLIEKRDTEIMLNAQKIAEQNVQIAAQNEQIAVQNEQIAEKNEQIAEQNEQIAEQKRIIRSSVLALAQTGLDDESIARCLNIDTQQVRQMKEKY
jgi:hypothetical protein